MWHSTCKGAASGLFTIYDCLLYVLKIGGRPLQALVFHADVLFQSSEEDTMIYSIEGGTEIKEQQDHTPTLIDVPQNVVLYLQQCCLSAVVLFVGRL